MRVFIITTIFIALVSCTNKPLEVYGKLVDMMTSEFTLSSSAAMQGFDNGMAIPDEFLDSQGTDCTGNNAFPALSWANPPTDTVEYALIVDDGFMDPAIVHLNIINIPMATTSIPYNAGDGGDMATDAIDLEVGMALENTAVAGNTGWNGPCPPADTGAHTYTFKVYALKTAITAEATSYTRASFEAAFTAEILGSSELTATTGMAAPTPALTLSSSAAMQGFDNGMTIPDEFLDSQGTDCTGENAFPALSWANPPTGTVEYALIVDDDFADPAIVHLSIVNIPMATTSIPYNAGDGGDTATTAVDLGVGTALENWVGAGNTGWNGPCPPMATGVHTYTFKVYALNTAITAAAMNYTRASFEAAFTAEILGSSELTATAGMAAPTPALTLSSSAATQGFDNGMTIPGEFLDSQGMNCTGQNAFPALSWANPPTGTAEYALIVDDDFMDPAIVHLNIINIPVATTSIPYNAGDGGDTATTAIDLGVGTALENWVGTTNTGWNGPCPPAATGVHTYTFKVYALNTAITAAAMNYTRASFEAAFTAEILGSSELTATAETP